MDWRKAVVLTKKEGEELEHIIRVNECANVSQLCKRIINGGPLCLPFIVEFGSDEDKKIIEKALSITQSDNIVEMCGKIANGKLAIIIK